MPSITFKIIEHNSPEYRAAVSLREEILRKPLGLTFSQEELEREKNHVHIAGFMGTEVIATAVLVPEEDIFKMQRVVVREVLQNKGMGSHMMTFCEEYARTHGFKEIYCYSRNSAVPFYLKNKYEPEGVYFNEDTIPHLKMWKVLKEKENE